MVPRLLRLSAKNRQRLIRLRKEAEREGACRVARRLHPVILNSRGRTSGEVAHSRITAVQGLLGCSPLSRRAGGEFKVHHQPGTAAGRGLGGKRPRPATACV